METRRHRIGFKLGCLWLLFIPAIFIYHDAKHLAFADSIMNKYHPSPDLQQVFKCDNGNYVDKYAIGQAVQEFPSFVIANILSKPLGYDADGFSPPYQLAIQLGQLIMAFWGLWMLRKILLIYFADIVVLVVMLLYVLGTNYLNYSSIDGALTHNGLFTWYCLLIYFSIQFHRQPSYKEASIIGLILGIMMLTRPTEILAIIIPLFWGIEMNQHSIKERFFLLKIHLPKLIIALVLCGMIGFIQLVYWKYVSGHWLVYSYQQQGFSWLTPHVLDYTFSYHSGWLTYNPMMWFAIIGFFFLKRNYSFLFLATALFAVLNFYVVTAWDVWQYGGRAMIQSYPILSFGMAAFITWIGQQKVWKYLWIAVCILFCYYNLWWTHQAHRGGLLNTDMTRAYFWKILGKYEVPLEAQKLLDTDKEFLGTQKNIEPLFHSDSTYSLDEKHQLCLLPKIPIAHQNHKWLRVYATCQLHQKEWDQWKMTQLVIVFEKDKQEIKRRCIRIQRLLCDDELKEVWIDVKLPKDNFDDVQIELWNAGNNKSIEISHIRAEVYNE